MQHSGNLFNDRMDRLLDQLNPAQKAAVTSNCDILQVLAPPGSGKTKTLTARVAHLLTHNGYRPENIICCTFTIKAAREMRERLTLLIGDQLESKLILGTFHSICLRYLKRYGYHIGLPNQFGVADSAESLAILRRIIRTRRYSIDEKIARSRISRRKAQGFGFRDPKSAKANSIDKQEFEEIFDAYENELSTSNRLDYDDLLLRCQQLLEEFPACVSNVEAVLIDEFQDTNTVQYQLMKLFASCHRRITIVGDPDQSIYGFRSAEIKNLTLMKAHFPETTAIILEENYRSCAAILNAAQNVIEQDEARPSKCLQATHSYGSLPVLRKLPSATAEAAWIVLEIQRTIAMTGNTLTYSDFAILLRSAHLSRQIESAMGKAGMPYQMVGGCRFYDRLEIRILLDYLKVIYQPSNNEALLAIMNVPSRKIGDKSKETLLTEAKEKGMALFNFVRQVSRGASSKARLSKPAEQNLSSLVSLIISGKETLKSLSPAADAPKILLTFLIKKLAFKNFLETTHVEDHESRWANVEELLSQAEDVSQHADNKTNPEALPQIEGIEQQEEDDAEAALSQFLANISLSSQADALEENAIQHKVTISTIHAAKGLEWPVVFVPALYNGSIPHSRAEDTDEERRLLYVAMTRAQALLYLSQPLHQSGAQSSEETELSSFLTPRSADKFFQALGPSFTDGLVQTVATTLRRPFPSTKSILQAMETIRSTEDDLWPESGERGQLDGALWDSMSGGSSKRKAEESSNLSNMRSLLGAGNTSNNSGALTSGNGIVSIGFTTAADHLRTQPPPTLAPTTMSAAAAQKKRTPSPDKPAKRCRIAPPPNQPTISSLFGQKQHPCAGRKVNMNSANGPEAADDLELTLPSPTLPSFPAKPSLFTFLQTSHQKSEPKPQSQLPTSLSTHRLPSPEKQQFKGKRPRPLLETDPNTKTKAYGFLSSSPPHSPQNAKADDTTADSENIVGDYKQVIMKPAETFHAATTIATGSVPISTSMTQLQAKHEPIKRRYGMAGAPMAGWNMRRNK